MIPTPTYSAPGSTSVYSLTSALLHMNRGGTDPRWHQPIKHLLPIRRHQLEQYDEADEHCKDLFALVNLLVTRNIGVRD